MVNYSNVKLWSSLTLTKTRNIYKISRIKSLEILVKIIYIGAEQLARTVGL